MGLSMLSYFLASSCKRLNGSVENSSSMFVPASADIDRERLRECIGC